MYLEKINSPEDIKQYTAQDRKKLAEEMRQAIIQRVSVHGGHLGPDLGFVEASIALHTVFNSPEDKIVFDVSHQCYPHKMLTGRSQAYLSPEHYDDISGYTNPDESEHDFFNVGHTSTSLSLASGLAKARDLKGTHENIIAVIGDGSMSGGEALEGLDTIGEMGTNLIIVFNDNNQSIAEVHGGMYKQFAKLRKTHGQYPHNLFRAMGLDYRFVEHGNDTEELIRVFRVVKDIDHPIVIHVVTRKGLGYKPAEENKEKWHSCRGFNIATGEKIGKGPNPYFDTTASYLLHRMKWDHRLAAIAAATPSNFGFTPDKRKEAGNQYIDVGIAEEQATAMASGMAKNGVHPVFATSATFLQRAYDQISQDVCINNNPVTFLVTWAGFEAMNDVTHLGIFDIPMLTSIPNLIYLAPTSVAEYRAILDWSINQKEHPVAIRVPLPMFTDSDSPVQSSYDRLNQSLVTHSGKDIAILGVGNMYHVARKAAAHLKDKGLDVTIINPLFLSGLDAQLLTQLMDSHRLVVTLEDGVLDGGFGEKVAAFYGPTTMRVMNFGLKKEFRDRYDRQELAQEKSPHRRTDCFRRMGRLLPAEINFTFETAKNRPDNVRPVFLCTYYFPTGITCRCIHRHPLSW